MLQQRSSRGRIAGGALVLAALLGLAVRHEAQASRLQARYFARQASQLTTEMGEGPSDRIRFPGDGPYDVRFGYARLPATLQSVTGWGYRIATQARVSERFADVVDRGVSPIFREKSQAGLRILDRRGTMVYESRHPERSYSSLDSVAPAVWHTLLFLENRELLDPRFPNHNPSVDWSRMALAGAAFARSRLGSGRAVPGASTLATQLEKFRHSTEGRTRSTREKLLQMEAAALRGYLDGENTEAARRGIVADYLNSVPLAAIAGHGEVTGLSDGLWAWYGADPDEVNRLLWQEAREGPASDAAVVARRAIAYRQVLSLMLAHRRPSYLLRQAEGRAELRRRTDQYLRLAAREGIISAALRDAALAVDMTLRGRAPERPRVSFIERKGANALRTELLGLTGVSTLYELDRFDLSVRTTLDLPVQEQVTELLMRLTDPAFVRKQGLAGLLRRGDPARVIYAVVLYERTEQGNAVRVEVDNFDAPFNVNQSSKLELGSTAKLRTLISYLEIVERLYLHHAGQLALDRRAERDGGGDRIGAWVLAYLADNPGVSLERTLQAAMSRSYAASPGESFASTSAESFFTGGGPHTFRNADTTHNHQALSVREAFIQSVNLPFIRIMRDIVHYHAYRLPGSAHRLVGHAAGTPDEHNESRSQEHVARLANGTGRAMHRLELRLAAYLRRHPGAPLSQMLDAIAFPRPDVPGGRDWPRHPAAPDQRVAPRREAQAYREIHRSWRRLGYPFESVVPSYATAIGSSADRPDQLAELVGILLNDGVRYPVRRVEALHFAAATPYETLLRLSPPRGERVLSPEIAAVVRDAMVAVASRGTARRAVGAVRAADGSSLLIGAKTGTGDNRFTVVGPDGLVTEDRAVDRTATVVFFIGDRLYGTITAFVSGAAADRYDFTSALPVHILKMLGPTLESLIVGRQD